MCRLFFSFHNKNIEPLLKEFLAQSIHRKKNTPGLQNNKDVDTHTDGFGIAWKAKNTDDWSIYKNPWVYTEDQNINKVISTIPNNIVIAHIRNKTYGDASLENTHPFHYKGHIFAQNGKIDEYEKHAKLLKSYICPHLLDEIRGETDTECLFFMFLSCIIYLENRKTTMCKNKTCKKRSKSVSFTRTQIVFYKSIMEQLGSSKTSEKYSVYFRAFEMLTHIFKKHKIELVANIVYGNEQIVLITRYIVYEKANHKEKQIPRSLYWNKCSTNHDTGVLITSEPLSHYESMLFPENTVTVVDYKKDELIIRRI
jgi:predicted glutamine amidotransferase